MSEAVERAFLGAVLQRSDVLFEHPITEGHFTSPVRRLSLKALLRIASRNDVVDRLALEAEYGKLTADPRDLAALRAEAIHYVGSTPHFDLLEEDRVRRELIAYGERVAAIGRSSVENPAAVYHQEAEKLAQALRHNARQAVDMQQLVTGVVEDIFSLQPGAPTGIETGFTDIDSALGGLTPGEAIVIAGRPAMGKSSLLRQIAVNAARRGEGVLFFSPEMSNAQFVHRQLAETAKIPLHKLRRNDMDENARRRLLEAAGSLPSLFLVDQDPLTLLDVGSIALRHSMQHKLHLIVLDYLQFMAEPRQRDEAEHEMLGRVVHGFKAIAKRLWLPFLFGSQIGRASEQHNDKRPTMGNLKSSGSIEEHSDTVMLLHRQGYYDKKAEANTAELIIAKNRNGPTGSVFLHWNAETTSFGNALR